MTFASGVHNPKIMFGMLVKVLCGDSIATRKRLPCKGNVTFEDLMRVASDFDVRTVTIESLNSVRYLLPIMVGIVTVIATIRSAGLSWSHDTCCIDEKWDLSDQSVSEHLGSRLRQCRAAFLHSAKLFHGGTLDGVILNSNGFLVQCPCKQGRQPAIAGRARRHPAPRRRSPAHRRGTRRRQAQVRAASGESNDRAVNRRNEVAGLAALDAAVLLRGGALRV